MSQPKPIKAVLVTLGVVTAIFGIVLLASVIYVAPRVSSKSSAQRSASIPQSPAALASPITQTEPHTCGFLALSSAYKVYGLSPSNKNLRFRLGVDREAHPFDEQSTGTLHPDIFRVLDQDGFFYTLVAPDDAQAGVLLGEHLDSGDLALLLIERRENNALHWVLADHRAGPEVRVVDSLMPQPYTETTRNYLNECVISIITIRAAAPPSETDSAHPHRDGVAELNRVRARIAQRKATD